MSIDFVNDSGEIVFSVKDSDEKPQHIEVSIVDLNKYRLKLLKDLLKLNNNNKEKVANILVASTEDIESWLKEELAIPDSYEQIITDKVEEAIKSELEHPRR